MKRFSFLWLTGMICLSATAQKTNIPAELKPFVPAGMAVLDFGKADLNKDGKTDYVLVVKIPGEDTMDMDNPVNKRPLYVIIRDKSGKLQLQAENKNIVYCAQCGGVMGEPYQPLLAFTGGFTLNFYGGSSWRWSDTYTFKFDAKASDWLLDSYKNISFHSGDPEHTTTKSDITRTEAGAISIKDFTNDFCSEQANWKVKAVKTYFYDSPSLSSKPRKGYVLKGNIVNGTKTFAHFVQCDFQSGDNVTSGYILKKDLEKLPAE